MCNSAKSKMSKSADHRREVFFSPFFLNLVIHFLLSLATLYAPFALSYLTQANLLIRGFLKFPAKNKKVLNFVFIYYITLF